MEEMVTRMARTMVRFRNRKMFNRQAKIRQRINQCNRWMKEHAWRMESGAGSLERQPAARNH